MTATSKFVQRAMPILALLGVFLAAQTWLEAQQSPAPGKVIVAGTLSGALPASPASLAIGAGDMLQLVVFDTPELSGAVRVSDEGLVNLALIGELHLGGLTVGGAEKKIRAALIDGGFVKNPQVSILVTEYPSEMVSVLGEVNHPGMFPSLGQHHLLDYISLAGGMSLTAGNVITVTHKSNTQVPERIHISAMATPEPASNPAILPGDMVYVERAGIVYVVGNVNRPGGFVLDRDGKLSVLKALALAQGFSPYAAQGKVHLIRKTLEGMTDIPIRLNRMLASKAPDVAMQDGDLLFVPNSDAKSAAGKAVNSAFSVATGVAIYRF